MTQIIQSGAFLQQCWSVHPLCVTVKRMTDDRTLVLTCSSCRFTHYLSVALVTPMHTAAQERVTAASGVTSEPGDVLLNRCISAHHAALSLREMDVFHDLVLLRCAECRRQYEVTVSAFKTHQR
jgi:hypothetical protein